MALDTGTRRTLVTSTNLANLLGLVMYIYVFVIYIHYICCVLAVCIIRLRAKIDHFVHLQAYSYMIPYVHVEALSSKQCLVMAIKFLAWSGTLLFPRKSFISSILEKRCPVGRAAWQSFLTPSSHTVGILWMFSCAGLWEACFDGYEHTSDYIGKEYEGCWWIFHKEYSYIREWLMPRK